MNIFVRMLREVYSIDRGIIEAPPRISLRMFGGPFDIETFREDKNICLVISPPFVSHSMLIEERVPNPNLGETSTSMKCKESMQSFATLKGSVKGLRRPIDAPLVDEGDEQICCPSEDGLYASFLVEKDKNEKNLQDLKRTTSAPQSATGKKQKVLKGNVAPNAKEGMGLARFACN